jgi:NPL4 family
MVRAVPKPSLTLRVRLTDGSIQRMEVSSKLQGDKTLRELLWPLMAQDDEKIACTGLADLDDSQRLQDLQIKDGTLLTLTKRQSTTGLQRKKTTTKTTTFDPFPDLARNYDKAARQHKASHKASYAALSDLSAAMHMVEPQNTGRLARVYMCRLSAERFQASGVNKNKIVPQCGLLLGTIQRERVDSKPRPKTSLSSTTQEQDYCQVAKVHAIWESPVHKHDNEYDIAALQKTLSSSHRVYKVAARLGLRPIGWIFSYTDSRSDSDGLPVHSQDVLAGANLQICNMQSADREEGSKFVTLCMEASSGATEGFLLSDQAVQMVAEKVWNNDASGRFVTTRHPILVDGRQTNQLDSVLCLVNLAMLSHVGWFAGPTASRATKHKDGSLTTKTKKAIVKAIDNGDDGGLLTILSDFGVLLLFDEILGEADSEKVCACVRKWSRGQKKGTALDTTVKDRIRRLLQQ